MKFGIHEIGTFILIVDAFLLGFMWNAHKYKKNLQLFIAQEKEYRKKSYKHLVHLTHVYVVSKKFFEKDEDMIAWLETQNPELENKTPSEMCCSDEGYEKVLNLFKQKHEIFESRN